MLDDRQSLANYGVVTVVITVDQSQRKLIDNPKVLSSGFMGINETQLVFSTLGAQVKESFSIEDGLWDDLEIMKSKLKEIVREYLFSKTRRQPIIIPIIKKI